MSDPGGAGTLARARHAATRGDWQKAFDLFMAADADGQLDPPDLPLLGDVAYAAGDLDVAIAAWERVYATCVEADDPVAAAGAAARVAMHLLFDTALMAPVRGWLARAERLLEGHAPSPAHAWHAVVRAFERMLAGDPGSARSWARHAIDVGTKTDSAACALGRVAEARLRILDGDVHRGLALLDDVGVAAVSGDLDPLSTGVVYCELVCALQGLGQYDAAEEWTEAMERWCRTNAIGSLHGRCRVHRAEILRLRGALSEAESEATAACGELRSHLGRELGWPLSELGRIRLHRGDVTGAERALLASHHAGWDPYPALALVRLAQGDVTTAAASIEDALERPLQVPSKERPPNNSLQRAPLLEAQVEIAIAADDVGRATTAADELEAIAGRYPSKALTAGAALARGRVCLAAGDAPGAAQHFSDAARRWKEIRAPYEEAAARTGLAEAHRAAGRDPQAVLESQAVRTILDGLADRRANQGGVEAGPNLREPDGQSTGTVNAFHREGDYWSVGFDERTVRVRDLKGMRYLARLLAEPGREFHVLDLVAAEGGGTPTDDGRGASVSDSALGDAGELLDDKARNAYRRRLVEIDEDIQQAHAIGDAERAAHAATERDFLTRELSRAFGLGGRTRRAGSASERARAAVTRALRTAMARIRANHPPLGEHLDRAVQTGAYCSYQPDPRHPIKWHL
jgi:tetratricopeptide (TPR) repeat protein